MRTLTSLLLPAVLFAGSARAQAPVFDVATATSFRSRCTLLAFDESGRLVVENAGARRTLDDVIEIQQEGRTLPPLLTRQFVSLSNGDRLPLAPDLDATLDASRLRVAAAPALGVADGKPLSLFAPNVVLFFGSVPEGVDDPERFFAVLQAGARKRDVAYLKDGDRIEGALTALSRSAGCTLLNDGKKTQIPWTKLAGIAFNTDRQARLRTTKRFARVILEDGARVNLLDLHFEEKTRRFVGKTQFGAILQLPEANIIAFDVRQASAIDLSELTPARYEHRPFLGVDWPLAKNAAATGGPLRLFGSTYESGLGTHAACSIAYKLDGKYQRFDALVGIDQASRKGRARAAIDLDGKRIDLCAGKELTPQAAPQSVRLDVRGIRTLTLIVEFGALGDVQANVNWAKARLVKNSE
ncbi:MAG: NPCBM/NEW2 domain-containing protein [Planctomycetes bacterium]|nr:NPCBM/NEW2 domain-containing protein [Planctomycetota bacterium]